MKHLLYIAAIILAFASCKPGIPADVLSEGTMVDVLYDMHVAQAMADDPQVTKNRNELIALRASVLKKHDISQAEWDSSFVFYCGHADYLNEVYQQLDERMNEEVEALGGQIEGIATGEDADTANIWRQEPYCFLMQQPPYDKMTFTIIPDSTVKDGDRINLQYESQLLFQDGMKDITVCLNVYYDNDSICTRINHISSSGHGIISISNDVDRLKIKKITGFFLMSQFLEHTSATGNIPVFKLAAIRNIKLLHLHTAPPAASSGQPKPERNDSLPVDSQRANGMNPITPPTMEVNSQHNMQP